MSDASGTLGPSRTQNVTVMLLSQPVDYRNVAFCVAGEAAADSLLLA
jgi:hypothetical protein